MNKGRAYVWKADQSLTLGGRVSNELVDLGELQEDGRGSPSLGSRLVEVRNGGQIYRTHPMSGEYEGVPIGNAKPDANGDFLFEAGKGGGALHKYPDADDAFKARYIQASHFGEVNTFYHLQKMSLYVDSLLNELGEPSLPPIVAIVNAHHAATERGGLKDGVLKADHRCVAFQGGHYRLPSKHYGIPEHYPLSATGEIHLGPGRQLLVDGALVEYVGHLYRANASHNAGIIFHEYGHHITRHTADFRANRLRAPGEQDNKKPAIDEGICDYFAAAMLETPHIWALHKRHDLQHRHPRSLVSAKTMDDFDASSGADPHVNGTIWAAALWDLRVELIQHEQRGARRADILVMKMLCLIAEDNSDSLEVKATRRLRSSYVMGLEKLIKADEILNGGRYRTQILLAFARRKIVEDKPHRVPHIPPIGSGGLVVRLPRAVAEDIPATHDILSASELVDRLNANEISDYSVIAAGDVMLGDRTRQLIREFGADYPFSSVAPLLQRSNIVVGNLEGPFARDAEREDRTFSYRVNPKLASSLTRAGINVVTIANNHLMDCGRAGVIETLNALEQAGVQVVGGGRNELSAHKPVVLNAGGVRIGILGYYWNRRCAATVDHPGGAMDSPAWLAADISALRERADRVVVTFHWGVPYETTPQPDDCEKARLAIDLGADLVIGHHPHVIQPFEVHNGRPIFYSVGNFTFGSGNSRAEGLLVATRFDPSETVIDLYAIYVKNRDPRVNYQPKVLGGAASAKILSRLAKMSGSSGVLLDINDGIGRIRINHGVTRPSIEPVAAREVAR